MRSICAGYSLRMSEKEASKIGVIAFLMKALDKAELAFIIRKVLVSQNQDEQL